MCIVCYRSYVTLMRRLMLTLSFFECDECGVVEPVSERASVIGV